jgi:hypothetical protein
MKIDLRTLIFLEKRASSPEWYPVCGCTPNDGHPFAGAFPGLVSHGQTDLSRLLMGSVAEQTLRGASCPVLLIKQGRGEKQ